MALKFSEGFSDPPERILVYGDPGTFKTRTLASAPRVVFLDLDGSTRKMRFVARQPDDEPITDYNGILKFTRALLTEPHPFKTLVIDTVDRVEFFLANHIAKKNDVDYLGQVRGGFNAGEKDAVAEFRRLIDLTERLWLERDMHVAWIGHAADEKVKPTGQQAEHKRTSLQADGLLGKALIASVDHAFYAKREYTLDEKATGDKKRKTYVAKASKERFFYTHDGGHYYAKTRARIPDKIEANWHHLACHLAADGYGRLLRETVVENARRLGDPGNLAKAEAFVRQNAAAPAALAQMNARLLELLAERDAARGSFVDPEPEAAQPAPPAPAAVAAEAPPETTN